MKLNSGMSRGCLGPASECPERDNAVPQLSEEGPLSVRRWRNEVVGTEQGSAIVGTGVTRGRDFSRFPVKCRVRSLVERLCLLNPTCGLCLSGPHYSLYVTPGETEARRDGTMSSSHPADSVTILGFRPRLSLGSRDPALSS